MPSVRMQWTIFGLIIFAAILCGGCFISFDEVCAALPACANPAGL